MTFMRQSRADQLVQAAALELATGQVALAVGLLDEALCLEPHHLMGLTKQAEAALFLKENDRALALADQALSVEPNFAPAWYERAAALWIAGRQPEAVTAARRAVEIQPPNPTFRLRFAQFAAWTGDGAATHDVLRPLLDPNHPDPGHQAAATSMLGELAVTEGRFEEAMALLDRALALRPGLDATRMLRGMNLLRLGHLREGWIDYAAREVIPALYPNKPTRQADLLWHGQDLTGKTILVTDDQGHGDAIQFFRYLPMLRDRGAAHVTWRTFPPLLRLFAASAPDTAVLDSVPSDARFDFECTSTSLPRGFGTELHSIPARIPYVRPSQPKASRRSTRRRLKVGLAWSGDTRLTRDHLRSIPAARFLALADAPGISFHSLQRDVRPSDLPALQARPAIGREVEQATDFADTAALIARLDLVIAVDTGVAHLAGALGKPVWLIVHVAADWRWLTERVDSPWYPSLRLFRVAPEEARADAAWCPVLDRVAAELRAFAAG
jgi:tetratricopeptide (TPR) repeat protein